jgi:acyl-[acyl-carrier-protein]-phospholipid O-acyltransferase/long-chain-fatty-acid--[acyl-carrier-protein] ligase
MPKNSLTASLLRRVIYFLLKLRYKIEVNGLEKLSAQNGRGILFLPNHPALIDPIILLSTLHRPFQPSILADKDRIDVPILRPLAALFGAVPMPDIARHGNTKRPEVEKALKECAARLERGENLIFYPAGRLYRSSHEDLGANSGVSTLLARVPNARVVLVRTSGLWGSVFSYASGVAPTLGGALIKAASSLMASFLFFVPRRKVALTFEEPAALPRRGDRMTLNRFLEAFYNADAPPNLYVPYSPWETEGAKVVQEPESGRVTTPKGTEIPAITRHHVYKKLAELSGVPVEKMRDDQELAHDLGLDSLALMELVTWAEHEFGYHLGETTDIQTVGDLLLAACGNTLAGEMALVPVPKSWFSKPSRERPCLVADGRNIPEAFLNQARRSPDRPILADQIAGVKTYRNIITAILLLKPEFEKFREPFVGIMLPASVSATTVYLAALFARKVPVMVNWTVGTRNMKYALDLMGVKHILTSQRVIERLESQLGPMTELSDRFVRLEEYRRKFTLGKKLSALAKAYFSWKSLECGNIAHTAVVLFTSGSESMPKAVPLTHENILFNLKSVLKTIRIQQTDVLLGMLPPFHSFGLSTNVVLPVISGLPVVYHSNPTEGMHLAKLAASYGATIAIGTPTFLSGMLRVASENDLRTLRVVVTGAEKCPDSIFDTLARFWPWISVLEGYGITECSPVVSINDENDIRHGTIGKVLPGIEYARKNVESEEPAPPEAPGLLLVRGPSIFGGYLHYNGPSPFLEWRGRRWYATGDLVTELPGGVLKFAGRLKRFVKLGGEMVSLPAIEDVLVSAFVKPDEKGPLLAVESTAAELNPEIVLFTAGGTAVTREEANEAIRKSGLSPLHNIRRVVQVPEIPLLGTGKIHFRALREGLTPPGKTP